MIEKLFLLRFFEKYPVVGWCFTFPAVVTGWVIFASDNLSAVKTYLMQMFGHLSDAGYWTMNLDLFEQTVRQYGIYLVLAFIFSTAWPYGKYRENKNRPLTILILLVLFGLCVYKNADSSQQSVFIFQILGGAEDAWMDRLGQKVPDDDAFDHLLPYWRPLLWRTACDRGL